MDMRATITALGGDYDALLHRLRRDPMIQHFLMGFLEDEEFSKLAQAMAENDLSEAFEAAHALKGVALNLELGNLIRSVVPLTEALRHSQETEARLLFPQVQADYAETVRVIQDAVQ